MDSAFFSRFDLHFFVIQNPNLSEDLAIGKKIVQTHKEESENACESEYNLVDLDLIRKYVKIAKKFQPSIPPVCKKVNIMILLYVFRTWHLS